MAQKVLLRPKRSDTRARATSVKPYPRAAAWVLWAFIAFGIGNILWLNSCSSEQEQQANNQTMVGQQTGAFKVTPNNGLFSTAVDQNAIHISFSPNEKVRASAIRLYDDMGGLVYIEKEVSPSYYQEFDIDCRYMKKGQYLLLVYLNNGHTLEEWVNVF